MSQSNNCNYMDYMDGVPVKISDKYKPPPEITLPYGVVESTARASESIQNSHYDFSLETNVLKKLVEWQNARETAKNARNHRLQLLDEAKQRELDLKVATENEEKLKQLSISEVSYPSTEEISEISPDDGECKVIAENVPTCKESGSECSGESQFQNNACVTKPDIVCDILQPVPVSPSPSPRCVPLNLLDDSPSFASSLQHLQSRHNMQFLKTNYAKNNVDNLTYSDFENDTSSPFDNMELKTINDKELLAQVLNINQTNNLVSNESSSGVVDITNQYNGYVSNHPYSNSHSLNCNQSNPNKPVYDSCLPCDTTVQAPSSNTVQPFSYMSGSMLHNNGYIHDQFSNVNVVGKPIHYLNSNIHYYAPEYNNYPCVNAAVYQPTSNISFSDKPNSYNNKLGDTNQYQRDRNNIDQSYINQYGYYDTNYYYANPTNNTSCLPFIKELKHSVEETTKLNTESNKENTLFGSRSRSVPDIVKELDEEVSMARTRAKERSHNCSPSIRPSTDNTPSTTKIIEQLDNPYYDLSPEMQGVCKRISSMGFPMDRVARACKDVGAEEKRIIEFLIVMGQLMDLGFAESSVGKALLKHNYNRDKALDELIS